MNIFERGPWVARLLVVGVLALGLGWYVLREDESPEVRRTTPQAEAVPTVTEEDSGLAAAVDSIEEGKRRLQGAINAGKLYYAQEVERYLRAHVQEYSPGAEAGETAAPDTGEGTAAVPQDRVRRVQPPEEWVRKAQEEGGKYPRRPADLGYAGGSFFPPDSAYEDRVYTESVDSPFRIEAVPAAPGSLYSGLCGILTLDVEGNRDAIGGQLPAAVCWGDADALRKAAARLRR